MQWPKCIWHFPTPSNRDWMDIFLENPLWLKTSYEIPTEILGEHHTQYPTKWPQNKQGFMWKLLLESHRQEQSKVLEKTGNMLQWLARQAWHSQLSARKLVQGWMIQKPWTSLRKLPPVRFPWHFRTTKGAARLRWLSRFPVPSHLYGIRPEILAPKWVSKVLNKF